MSRRPAPLYLVYDGTALDGHVFRVVRSCPPTLVDFCSYEALGRDYDRRDYFRALGVSMLTRPERAIELARRFELGPAIATLDLKVEHIVWTASGTSHHITAWAPPGVFLARVVQCERYG